MWDKTANLLSFKYMTKDELSLSMLDIESKNRDRDNTDGVSAAWLKRCREGAQSALPFWHGIPHNQRISSAVLQG
jgi:hypothetical protein